MKINLADPRCKFRENPPHRFLAVWGYRKMTPIRNFEKVNFSISGRFFQLKKRKNQKKVKIFFPRPPGSLTRSPDEFTFPDAIAKGFFLPNFAAEWDAQTCRPPTGGQPPGNRRATAGQPPEVLQEAFIKQNPI